MSATVPAILFGCLAYVLATFLPGYFFSKLLRSPIPWLSAFFISVTLLCYGFIWLEIAHIPLRFGTMLAWELFWTLLGLVLWRLAPRAEAAKPKQLHYGGITWLLLAMVVIMGALLAMRVWLVPMSGPDLCNRWDQLAREVMLLGHYHYYPPQTTQDFQHYAFAESLPPMLTSMIWWIYASLGTAMQRATSLFIVLQVIVLLGLVNRLALRFSTPLAAAIATLLVAATPLGYFALAMGQEAGLIAIGVMAMLYFVLPGSDIEENEWRSAVLAGIAAAFAPLSREYGFAFVLLGLILAIWYRRRTRWIILFCLTIIVLDAPWYLRTWILTGNPFYSLSILNLFPTNPIVAGQYRIAAHRHSIWTMPLSGWHTLLVMAMLLVPIQTVLTIPILLAFCRRHIGLVIAFVICFAAWFMSVGISDGGLYWMRTLLAALAVISVLMGIAALDLLRRWKGALPIVLTILIISWVGTFIFGMVYPHALSHTVPAQWPELAFSSEAHNWQAFAIDADFAGHLPPGCRVLSTDIFAWSAYQRSPNPVVPIWSPEVRFIFDSSLPLPQVYERLQKLHICAIWYETADNDRFPPNKLYEAGPTNWKKLNATGGFALYRLPE